MKYNLTPQQLNAIKRSKSGELPKFLSIGNRKAGASLTYGKSGAEVQAGAGPVHFGAGFDTRRKSGGADLRIGNKQIGFKAGLGRSR